jgi:hypothetical protein
LIGRHTACLKRNLDFGHVERFTNFFLNKA